MLTTLISERAGLKSQDVYPFILLFAHVLQVVNYCKLN